MKKLLSLLILVLFAGTASAEITLPKVIGDNMVLQQQKPVVLWGTADPGRTVTVKFRNQTVKTKADDAGKWRVGLDPLEAGKTPETLTISDGKSRVTLRNILVGEVWLASGQSNMEFPMKNKYPGPAEGDDRLKIELESPDAPLVRVLYVEKKLNTDSLPSVGWQEIDKSSLAPVSAPAYFFAKKLAEELDVPVGFISTSWGGTLIETWTPEQAYLESPVFSGEVKNRRLDHNPVGERFDKMVEPLIPYTLRGFIWYQGESNLMNGDILRYAEKQKVLIDWWRKSWNDPQLPFYYVQLAPHTYSQRRGDRFVCTWESLPEFWEAQALLMDVPRTGMVVTTDLVDNPREIHPPYKWIVGERLAAWALANDYGRTDLPHRGPQYKRMTFDGGNVVVEFDHVGGGLASSDGKPIGWFQVCGPDGRFRVADARIEGPDRIVVSSQQVTEPVAVRFAWDEVAKPNLVNQEGFPAVPFRTNGAVWNYLEN